MSVSCDSSFDFSIDGHQFTIIEADGNNVEPLLVDSLTIYAGMCCAVKAAPVFHANVTFCDHDSPTLLHCGMSIRLQDAQPRDFDGTALFTIPAQRKPKRGQLL